MKVLTRDRIVESVKFPLSEALTFGIILWTFWGLGEAFYWEKLASLFAPQEAVNPHIYIASFMLYLLIAAVLSIVTYSLIKLVMVLLDRFDPFYFRAITLSLILLTFFGVVLTDYVYNSAWAGSAASGSRYGVMIGASVVALVMTAAMFRWALDVDFRIKRSGTIMLFVLVVSLLLSFVRFPLFSEKTKTPNAPLSFGFAGVQGVQKLAAYNCLSAYFPSLRTANE